MNEYNYESLCYSLTPTDAYVKNLHKNQKLYQLQTIYLLSKVIVELIEGDIAS